MLPPVPDLGLGGLEHLVPRKGTVSPEDTVVHLRNWKLKLSLDHFRILMTREGKHDYISQRMGPDCYGEVSLLPHNGAGRTVTDTQDINWGVC